MTFVNFPKEPTSENDSELVTLGSLLGPALDRAERRRSGDEKPIPVPWPAYADALGGGLWPGAHYIVSGTGVGKSQMTIQMALGAAKAGVPTVYIGLELEEMQIAMRVLGEQTGLRWSKLYLGRCNELDIARARTAAASLDGLPFFCDFAPARGWPASRLAELCKSVRKQYPSGPLLVVLDYLQLVGDEPSAGFERRPDLRERISDAAVKARNVARRFDASVVLISSAARSHYGLLASDAKDAGLTTRKVAGYFSPVRTISRPSVLLGLGKESGETEYSADSVTALIRWPAPLDNGETVILCTTPKVRSVGERWCALAFDGGRFVEMDVEALEDLPEPPKRGGKGKPVDGDEYEARVLAAIAASSTPLKSQNAVVVAAGGNRTHVMAAIKRLIECGRISNSSGWFRVVEGENQ